MAKNKRFFEVVRDYDVDKKALLSAVQAAGFEVKNNLAAVDDAVETWIGEQAKQDWPALGGVSVAPTEPAKPKKKAPAAKKPPANAKEGAPVNPEPEAKEASVTTPETAAPPAPEAESESCPAVKTKVKARKKVKQKVKKVVSGAGLETERAPEPAPEPEPEVAPNVPAVSEEEPVEVEAEEPAPEKEPTIAIGSVVVPAEQADAKAASEKKKKDSKEKKAKSAKPKQSMPKARGGKEIKLHQQVQEADLEGEDADEAAMILKGEGEEEHHTGTHHKRADFRSQNRVTELPAIFNDQNASYNLARSMAGGGGGRRRRGGRGRGQTQTRRRGRRNTQTVKRERDPDAVAVVQVGMTVRELSTALGIKINDIVQFFMKGGQLVNVNETLSEEDIQLIAEEFKVKYDWKAQQDLEQELETEIDRQESASTEDDMVTRPPVVTFLGHVDHGKTSLMDKIRSSRVAEHEAGGITQHMGAYNVQVNDQMLTFLDTPGHEAFTAMRARGANLTDVAVLVVAADDGVMPQTEEACSHARNADVPIVVAINKCDLPGANPDKVRQELATRLNLMPEEWGGTTGMVEVSAITGEGTEGLLERILLESEILELQADPNRPATGYIIEARVSESRGVVATILINGGTLRRGDVMLSSMGYGKVKLMYDEHGHTIEAAGPGMPVQIVGLNTVPEAGDKFYVLNDIAKARNIAEQREHEARSKALSRRSHVTLENLQAHLAEASGGTKELRVIIKADVKGSIEVLEKTLMELATDEVKITIIHSAVGGINQADVILADASDAVVVGFHVVADNAARLQAQTYGVQVKTYHIIYRLIEDMKAALEGMLPPEEREIIQGHVQIRQVFKASRVGNIAGCYVVDGLITRHSRVRVIRDSIVIYDGVLDSLKRFKDDAREVREGYECGLKIAGYDDIKEADMLEAYTVEEVARKLE